MDVSVLCLRDMLSYLTYSLNVVSITREGLLALNPSTSIPFVFCFLEIDIPCSLYFSVTKPPFSEGNLILYLY